MNAHARLVARLERERISRGLNDRQMADVIGMSPSWFSELKDGGVGKTLGRLDKIADKLGLAVDDLFRDPAALDATPTDGLVDAGREVDTVATTQSHGGMFRAEDSDVEYDLFERSLHLQMHAIYKEHGREGLWSVKDAIDEALRNGPKASRRELRDGAQTK